MLKKKKKNVTLIETTTGMEALYSDQAITRFLREYLWAFKQRKELA